MELCSFPTTTKLPLTSKASATSSKPLVKLHSFPSCSADSKGQQRIELILPSAPDAPIPLPEYDPASAGRDVKRIPRNYDLKLTSEAQQTAKRNIFAFREKHEGDDEEELDDDEDISSAGGSSSTTRPLWRRKRAKSECTREGVMQSTDCTTDCSHSAIQSRRHLQARSPTRRPSSPFLLP